ncbi:hypothetical protein [Lewinella sp. IMCC34191]|uniref:hypothetical protein n=1 Tax=Lewinella sp. IMCC34191 TaxID=2259172 RepID=UPI000E2409DF|nr:hypothetical protein [Lewinella sp. IMCC34191]
MRISLWLFLVISACTLPAQNYEDRINPLVGIGDTSQTHQVILRDYTRLRGTVMSITPDSLYLLMATVPEPVAIPTDELRHLGLYVPEQSLPFRDTRSSVAIRDLDDLTYLRTALPYSSDRRFKSVMLIYNSIDWSLNDHFQIGTGLAGPLGILFSQRYRTSLNDYLHIGVSNEFLIVPIAAAAGEEFPVVGDLTSMLTVGSASQFFHAGVGMFYGGGGGSIMNFRVGTGVRVSRRLHLYGEMLGYFDKFDGLGILPSLNVSVAKRRHRWSYGVMGVFLDAESVFAAPIPYISYTVYH